MQTWYNKLNSSPLLRIRGGERKVEHEKTQTSPGALADSVDDRVHAHALVGHGGGTEKYSCREHAGNLTG